MTDAPGPIALIELRLALEKLLGHPIPPGTDMRATAAEVLDVAAELTKLRAARRGPLQVPIVLDDSLPTDTILLRDSTTGKILGTIRHNPDDTFTVDRSEEGDDQRG